MPEPLTEFEELCAAAHAEALSGTAARIPLAHQPILNGLPYRAFRKSVGINDRREAGAFFSGAELAQELARLLHAAIPVGGRVIDPTCGIGDLLLAYASQLPLEVSLVDTLSSWGKQIAGIDRRDDLVAMARARLVALARARGSFDEPIEAVGHYFPDLVAGDMFEENERIAAADGILFNPPFGRTKDHRVADWSSGNLCAAALFLDAIVTACAPGVPIAAVLPEVLRCGSRYTRFRKRLSDAGFAGGFSAQGRFDRWTDVDVFTTLLTQNSGALWASEAVEGDVIGDRFKVLVGAVVPHRHTKGQWRRYICAKSVPAWSTAFTPMASRRFRGTLFNPPFVVVRRTSSPSDRKRAVGAIIIGDHPVAAENHLIVLLPNDGSLESCVELLAVLDADATTDHLNRTIRCRHLTTGSVKGIPWIDAL